jgi:deoxyxylulose-5-phosphate synthase
MICSKLNEMGHKAKIKTFAYRDEFIPQGSITALQGEYGVNFADIEAYIKGVLA